MESDVFQCRTTPCFGLISDTDNFFEMTCVQHIVIKSLSSFKIAQSEGGGGEVKMKYREGEMNGQSEKLKH